MRERIIASLEQSQSPDDIPLEPRGDLSLPIKLTGTQSLPWYFTEGFGPKIMQITFAFRLVGRLDVDVLRDGVRWIQLRHEALRLKMGYVGADLVQRLAQTVASTCPVVAIGSPTPTDLHQSIQAHIRDFVAEGIQRPLDATFNSMIIKARADQFVLVISVDHIVVDADSIEIFLQDLWRFYVRAVSGKAEEMTRPPIQFSDYAAWLSRVFPTWKRRHLPHWIGHMSGARRIQLHGQLHGDTPQALVTRRSQLSAVSGELARLGKTFGALPLMVLLSAYALVVSKSLAQSDLTITFVDRGRHRPELVSMVGCLASHLLLRIDVKVHAAFIDFVREVSNEYYSACEHRDFDWLPSIMGDLPADILFNARSAEGTGSEIRRPQLSDSLRVEPFPVEMIDERRSHEFRKVLPFKLGLGLNLSSEGLTCAFFGHERLFDLNAVERMNSHFALILEKVVSNPFESIESLLRAHPHV